MNYMREPRQAHAHAPPKKAVLAIAQSTKFHDHAKKYIAVANTLHVLLVRSKTSKGQVLRKELDRLCNNLKSAGSFSLVPQHLFDEIRALSFE